MVDVRIITSTNQNLEEKMKSGEFREDFFYRINVLPIKLPSLREHPEDIPMIANHLLEKHCAKMNKPQKKISAELMEAFINQTWEGNVREMENVIIQGILFSAADQINPGDLNLDVKKKYSYSVESVDNDLPYKTAKEKNLKIFNHSFIGRLLETSNGNVSQAARQCGLERQALQQIMRRYQIDADDYRN